MDALQGFIVSLTLEACSLLCTLKMHFAMATLQSCRPLMQMNFRTAHSTLLQVSDSLYDHHFWLWLLVEGEFALIGDLQFKGDAVEGGVCSVGMHAHRKLLRLFNLHNLL